MTILVGCLDLESTGVNPAEDRIVEVALKVIELEGGTDRLTFARRVNPGIHIPARAVEVHGIADADVVGAPPFSAIAGGLAALLGRLDLLVGHNVAPFDLPLLVAELVRAGLPAPKLPPVIDTMLEGRFATFDGKVPTLGELCFALDVPYDPEKAHAAEYDVTVNLAAFRQGWKLGAFRIPPSITDSKEKEAA